MQSRYFSFHKTCNNVTKFQAIFIINYLAGENEENKIINAEEITKHGKCLWGVSKYKWERKPALFQNILKFCIFLPKPVLPFLPFFVVFEKSCTCSCPGSHGELGKICDFNFILTFAFTKFKIRWYYNGINDVTMQRCNINKNNH